MLNSTGANLYVCTDGGTVFCLDAATDDPLPQTQSRVRWQVSLASYQTTIRSAPALNKAGTALYVHTVGSNAKLYALNPDTGAQLWTTPPATGNAGCSEALPHHPQSMVMSSGPAVAANGSIYVGTSAGTVRGFDASGSSVLNVNLRTILGETGLQIEAPLALGLNGWVYVGTRAYVHAGSGALRADLVAIDPTAPAGPAQVRWRQVVETTDLETAGILVSPVLDRSGYVYATEFGHFIQQHDAIYGTLTRSWGGTSVIRGKLCQTPALTEDGLLIMGTSGLGLCGHGRLIAIRSLGNGDGEALWEALWEAPLDLQDGQGICLGSVDVLGSPAIRSNGLIYVADTAGRVLRFSGTTPMMEGPWPALGGGNRHAGSPLDYAWNVAELYGPGDTVASSTPATVASISPRGWAVGFGTGAWTTGSYPTPGAAFWNPLGAKYASWSQSSDVTTAAYVNQWTRAENANSLGDMVGTYLGSTGSQYQAVVWPLGQLVSVNYTLLPLPSGSTTSFATAVTEDGTVVGYTQNGTTFTRVTRWTKSGSSWIFSPVTGLTSDQAYAFSASGSGTTVGKAKFETGGSAPFRAFRLRADFTIFNPTTDDLGTVADTPTQREFTRNSEALEVRDDFGIVGRSQNLDGVWRAYAIAINEAINNSKALGGLLAAGTGTTWTSAANSLNRLGVRVGVAQANNPAGGGSLVNRAVVWDPATGNVCTDLNGRLPANSGWVLTSAESISDSGFIVGYGTKNGAAGKVYLLYPARNVN